MSSAITGTCDHTNGRAELAAVLVAARKVAKVFAGVADRNTPYRLTVYTTSDYVMRGVEGNLDLWHRRGWVTASGTAVLFKDRWMELDGYLKNGFGEQCISLEVMRLERGTGARTTATAAAWARQAADRHMQQSRQG